MDIMTSLLCGIVCISQLVMIFAHEHFSKFQMQTYPKTLFKCNNMSVTFGEVSHEQEKEQIVSFMECFKGDAIKAFKPNITQERINQFNEAIRQMTSDHWRVKRQANRRIRREVRSLNPREWRQVTRQFNRIFNSGVLGQIVSFHSEDAIGGAHGGPAFLGWHRILLLWIEFYLRLPMPYWDSSLDFHITDPTRSILWTRHYFGNGQGTVRTGPFRTFTEPGGNRITRNIGMSGTLIARENIDSIVNRNSNRELIYTDLITMEGYHNGPHVWVGGTLLRVVSAPADPCFWFHHSFIDKLWRDAQQSMTSREEYPFEADTNPQHGPRQNMAMFPVDPNFPLLNEDGYMNWVARRTQYQRSPGQATRRSQCGNPTWRNRQVLNWDQQRRMCVTGEGNPADFNTPADPQANRLLSAAFNDGSSSAIEFQSPLTDARTMANTDSPAVNSLGADSTSVIRNGDFNMFISPIRDSRTINSQWRSTTRPTSVNRQSRQRIVDEIIARLASRQIELLSQVASQQSSFGIRNPSVNINSLTSGIEVPIGSNVLTERPTIGQTIGRMSGQTSVPAALNSQSIALLTRLLQQRNNQPTIGSIDFMSQTPLGQN